MPARWPRASGLPWGLVGMVGLLAIGERIVADRVADRFEPDAVYWHEAARSAAVDAPGREILVFGDSLAKLGMQPRLIEERTGASCRNLAIPAGHASNSYLMLKRSIEAGANPRLIVVDFEAYLLAASPVMNSRRWAGAFRIREMIDLAATAGDLGMAARFAARLALPSTAMRGQARTALWARLRGEPSIDEVIVNMTRRNLAINDGALLPGPNDVPDPDPPPGLGRPWWRPHRANLAYARRFLDLAGSRGVTVAWVLMPIRSDCAGRRAASRVTDREEALVRRLQGEFANLVVLDGRSVGLADADFRDPTHLNRAGAIAFSAALAETISHALADCPPPGTWIAVVPVPARDLRLDLEDVDQSRLAVMLAGARR